MNHYIFFTSDGFTQDNSGKETENCQILGWAEGETVDDAFLVLIAENKSIKQSNYDSIQCQETKSNKIKTVLSLL